MYGSTGAPLGASLGASLEGVEGATHPSIMHARDTGGVGSRGWNSGGCGLPSEGGEIRRLDGHTERTRRTHKGERRRCASPLERMPAELECACGAVREPRGSRLCFRDLAHALVSLILCTVKTAQ